MNENLKYECISDFQSEDGNLFSEIQLSYEIFGQKLNSNSRVVLVCHALTGNSTVTGPKGWWNAIIGENKLIDTNRFTVVGINIPGNGYENDKNLLINDYNALTARDIAKLFGLILQKIGIKFLDIAIGGSLGGGICWELAVQFPDFVGTIVPVASDWKATDWVLAHNLVQSQILKNSSNPIHDARMMAMMFYRTPQSFRSKFDRSKSEKLPLFNVETWLLHHGEKLNNRFYLEAYLLMNSLLSTLDITKKRGDFESVAKTITAKIVMVGIDTDFFFMPYENIETLELLQGLGLSAEYKEIKSIHGHDGFLIEFEQLSLLLNDVFKEKPSKG